MGCQVLGSLTKICSLTKANQAKTINIYFFLTKYLEFCILHIDYVQISNSALLNMKSGDSNFLKRSYIIFIVFYKGVLYEKDFRSNYGNRNYVWSFRTKSTKNNE